jgi:FkbM family methyltransferase
MQARRLRHRKARVARQREHPSWLERLAGRYSGHAALEVARRATYRVQSVLHTENHDPRRNGELWLLRALGRGARTIVDVGAHHGDWTALALDACPCAHVHAFELVDDTRAVLRRRFGGHVRVTVADCGLLDRAGAIPAKHYPSRPAVSSVVDYPHPIPHVWREERVMRGDDYLARLGDPPVDLLKVDAEGSDLRVLEGFSESLSRGRVRVVQFEYGYAGIKSGALLQAFYGHLSPHGYAIGRLRPDRVDFQPYRPTDERFFGPNFVAVRTGAALPAALRADASG